MDCWCAWKDLYIDIRFVDFGDKMFMLEIWWWTRWMCSRTFENFPEFCFWSSFRVFAWLLMFVTVARATFLKLDLLRVLAGTIPLVALAFFFSYASHVHHACFIVFLFFFNIQNSITPKPQIQIDWDFLCHDPCNLYFFLVIFIEIVHVWIFIFPRECSYMCFLDMSCHFDCEMMRFCPTLLKFCVLKIGILMVILV